MAQAIEHLPSKHKEIPVVLITFHYCDKIPKIISLKEERFTRLEVGVAQMVERLPSKCEALNSNARRPKKKEERFISGSWFSEVSAHGW
jgi:hypothetical protein